MKKKYEPSTKRFSKFLLKLFIGFVLLKFFIFIYRFSDPFIFSSIDLMMNIIIISLFGLTLIFYFPYYKILDSIKNFFMNLKIKNEDECIKTAINYIFQFILFVYLVLLVINEFNVLGFNLNYALIFVVMLGALSMIFSQKKNKS